MFNLNAAAHNSTANVPWQAPATIIASLFMGVMLAIGHHLFYNSLHGQQARTDGYKILGSDISPQQMAVAGGTALAFLVKAALVTALSTAYLQLLWRALLRKANGSKLGDLDTAFSGLNNILSISKLWVWRRLPLLFSLAVVAWLLPLAAVVTPATLSIETAEVLPRPSELEIVPSLAFESLDFVDDMPPVPDDDNPDTLRFKYTIPAREVIEVVKAVAATGSILPVSPPSANSTWSLNFPGPALKCSNITEPLSASIRSNIADATHSASDCAAYGYLAWLEGMPFNNDTQEEGTSPGDYAFNSRIFQGTSMPATLYITASPEAMKMKEHNSPPAACTEDVQPLYELDAGAVMLRCDLRESMYHVHFNYTNGLQEVSVETTPLDDTPIQTVSTINCTTPASEDASCDYTPDILRTLSYQATMDAVTYLITGFINAEQNSTSPLISTQVISTALISTPELRFLTKSILEQSSTVSAKTLQQNILSWQSTRDRGLVKEDAQSPAGALAETIEQLFQNATVSMMGQEQLQPNASSASAPSRVNVSHQTFHNIYTYSQAKLWIAYSVAIIFTALSSVLGLVTVAASGASYSSSASFSSAFRLAKGAQLSAAVRTEDIDGRDPLPSHLASAKVYADHSRPVQGSRVDSMLLSRRSRTDSIALNERPKSRPSSSSASLLKEPGELERPPKPWDPL